MIDSFDIQSYKIDRSIISISCYFGFLQESLWVRRHNWMFLRKMLGPCLDVESPLRPLPSAVDISSVSWMGIFSPIHSAVSWSLQVRTMELDLYMRLLKFRIVSLLNYSEQQCLLKKVLWGVWFDRSGTPSSKPSFLFEILSSRFVQVVPWAFRKSVYIAFLILPLCSK